MLPPLSELFPGLTATQLAQYAGLPALYADWNAKINVISRKDMDNFYERHLLHSLAIARFISFKQGSAVLDAGTGGGFPGIPLAIMFPETQFTLADSVGKKINVVNAVAESLGLQNVRGIHARIEGMEKRSYDFVVTRAVAPMPDLVRWTKTLLRAENRHNMPNGIIALKGGDLREELRGLRCTILNISDWWESEYFSTKKIVYWHP